MEYERFVNLMAQKQVIIADGHHRYAGSLAYMEQQMAANPAHTGMERYNYHLMWLTNTEAEDLRILPTHRLIKDIEKFDETAILQKFDRHFTVKPVPNPDNMDEIIAGKQWTFGLIFQDNAYQVSLKPEAHLEMKWNFPDNIKALDLTVLHYFVIQEILNNLCDLRVLCGEILLENGIGFHEVSYKASALPPAKKRPV